MADPTFPAGLTARPLTRDDLPAAAALFTAAERIDDTGEHHDADDLAEHWFAPFVDPARDTLVVLDGGQVVAVGAVVAPPTFRDVHGVHLDGRVHPDHRGRGIGRALLAWQLARGAELHAALHPEVPGRLTVLAMATISGQEALLRRAGLAPQRWYAQMARPLTDLPPAREAAGVQLVAFDWARDDDVRLAHNAAFTEHYGSSERDTLSWESMFTGQRAFRPDLSVLALGADGTGRGDAVLGYALAYVYASDTAATGATEVYYGQIGVVPAARGRGLSKAVIVRALAAAADAGCDSAALEVDSENVTGALGLYESLGFRTARTQVSWSHLIPPAP